jgi:protein-disulfide isomerase
MGRFYALLGLIALIGVGTLAYVSNRPKRHIPIEVDPNLAAQAEGHLIGKADAPLQVLEFADFECPGCANFATVTEPDVRKRLIETGQISLRYFDFPLPQHKNSWAASHAAMCAEEQGKFWEMHDRLFQGQDQWNTQATSNPKSVLKGYAQELGLNVPRWEQCFDDEKFQKRIEANKAEALRRQVNVTPTFVVGKRLIPGAPPYDLLKAYVDSAVAERPAASSTPAASSLPTAGAPVRAGAADSTARR